MTAAEEELIPVPQNINKVLTKNNWPSSINDVYVNFTHEQEFDARELLADLHAFIVEREEGFTMAEIAEHMQCAITDANILSIAQALIPFVDKHITDYVQKKAKKKKQMKSLNIPMTSSTRNGVSFAVDDNDGKMSEEEAGTGHGHGIQRQATKFSVLIKRAKTQTQAELKEVAHVAKMPNYIAKAIWFRSDDENVEMLVDTAINTVLKLDLWQMADFVENLYSDANMHRSVTQVFEELCKVSFFERFVRRRFRRQLIKFDLEQEQSTAKKAVSDQKRRKEKKRKNKLKNVKTYRIWYDTQLIHDGAADNVAGASAKASAAKANALANASDPNTASSTTTTSAESTPKKKRKSQLLNIGSGARALNSPSADGGRHHHKQQRSGNVSNLMSNIKNTIRAIGQQTENEGPETLEMPEEAKMGEYYVEEIDAQEKVVYGDESVQDEKDPEFEKNRSVPGSARVLFDTPVDPSDDGAEWACFVPHVFGKKCPVFVRACWRKQFETRGKFQVLNTPHMDEHLDTLYPARAMPMQHVRIVFEMVRHYFELRINTSEKSKLKLATDKTPLRVLYVQDFKKNKKQKCKITINIQGRTYILHFWNGAKRNDCNAFSISRPNAKKKRHRTETQYLRYEADDPDLQWQWYDNDTAQYTEYDDYKNNINMTGLLKKELEAIYLANLYNNFPWDLKWHSKGYPFNLAQFMHLAPVLEQNGINLSTMGYLIRFTQSKASKLVTNIEQIAISKSKDFPRLIRTIQSGRNRMFTQNLDSNPFIEDWKATYLLSEFDQQKFFCAYIVPICAKIKYLEIEIENQLVTVPNETQDKSKKKELFQEFSSTEVQKEKRDIQLYDGFLIPPSNIWDAIDIDNSDTNDATLSLQSFVGKLSNTGILRKARVELLGGADQIPHSPTSLSKGRARTGSVFKYQPTQDMDKENNDVVHYLWRQTPMGYQYNEDFSVMMRFTEIIRKFVLESEQIQGTFTLWPYYRNSFHKLDYTEYHTLVNKFNLATLYTPKDIKDLFTKESEVIDHSFFSHCCCCACADVADEKDAYDDDDVSFAELSVEEEKQKESTKKQDREYIRHRRKLAGQLILNKWDTFRNLNILRHQLPLVFEHHLSFFQTTDRHSRRQSSTTTAASASAMATSTSTSTTERALQEANDQDTKKQQAIIDYAEELTVKAWDESIRIVNQEFRRRINDPQHGWQLLEDNSLNNMPSINIERKQYPLYESFMHVFCLEEIDYDPDPIDVADDSERKYMKMFLNTWHSVPGWWTKAHDLVLLELALKFNIDHRKYLDELTGQRASEFRVRLQDEELLQFAKGNLVDMETGQKHQDLLALQKTNSEKFERKQLKKILAAEELKADPQKPYLEFQYWIKQLPNVVHRLRYLTNILMRKLVEPDRHPSIISIRIQREDDQPKFDSQSSFFSTYEADAHKEWVANNDTLDSITIDVRVENTGTLKLVNKNKNKNKSKSKSKNKSKGKSDDDSHGSRAKYNPKKLMRPYIDFAAKSASAADAEAEQKSGPKVSLFDAAALVMKKDDSGDESEEEEGMNGLSKTNFSFGSSVEMATNEDGDEKKEANGEENNDDDGHDTSVRFGDEEGHEPRITDPFTHRDLVDELDECMLQFDLITHGEKMAIFVIKEINKKQRPSLWVALGIILEAMPFQMGLRIIEDQINMLRRGEPEQLDRVCRKMVQGTNNRIAASLRMAEYFDGLAGQDQIHKAVWEGFSNDYEKLAHQTVNDIESDHLLFVLMNIPLQDTTVSMTPIQLAIEQKRISFLNNERIEGVMNHIWQFGTSIHPDLPLLGEPIDFVETLEILLFRPFKFYKSPMGFNWTIGVVYIMYLIYVLTYAYYRPKLNGSLGIADTQAIAEMLLWVQNGGYILYEFSEFMDKGRQYFSVAGLMNLWDMLISALWIILFVVRIIVFNQGPSDLGADELNVFEQAYYGFFAFEIVLISTRFVTIFQSTPYLGVLLRIIQLMFQQIGKFAIIGVVVIFSFLFGMHYIYGETPGRQEQGLGDTFLYVFQMFLGIVEIDETETTPALFGLLIIIGGMLVLTNILIALMTTEYDNFQDEAEEEVAYMKAETYYDLANRDRSMPPPFNVLAIAFSIVLYIVFCLFALCGINAFGKFNEHTQDRFDNFYWGWNPIVLEEQKEKKLKLKEKHRLQKEKGSIAKKRKMYKNTKRMILVVFGLSYLGSKLKQMFIAARKLGCCRRSCFWNFFCCSCDYCCIIRQRRMRNAMTADSDNAFEDDNISYSESAIYHKGCYTWLKIQGEDGKQTVKGITMKEYIDQIERAQGSKLDTGDKITLKHLTVDTLFCEHCYKPFVPIKIDSVMIPPFRVMLELVSYILFILIAYPFLVGIFVLFALWDGFGSFMEDQLASSKAEDTTYSEYDREYFPHSERYSIP